jgi:hypothetical protein
MATL